MAFNKEKVMDAARKFVDKGQIDKAVKEYLRIVHEDPKDVRVWLKIGDLYAKKGAKQDAIETYLKVARFYHDQGFLHKSVAVYKQIVKLDPRLVDVILKLAELYRELRMMPEAMQHFESVAAHFHREGNTKEALAAVKKLVDIDPENIATRIKLAELYSKEGLVDDAATEFQLACEQLRRQGRQDDFLKVAERLLWHKPSNQALNRELAGLYLRRSDPRRALQKLQACFKADPRDVETLGLLAQAFQALDQKAKTASVLKELARIHVENKHKELAGDVFRKILELLPGDPDAIAFLGPSAQAGSRPSQSPVPRATTSLPAQVRAQAGDARFNLTGDMPPYEPASARMTGSMPLIDEQSLSGIDFALPEYDDSDFSADMEPPPDPRAMSAAGERHAEEIQKILAETDVYVKYGLHQKAIDHLRRVFTLDADNVEARERLKDIFLSQNREAEAEAELMRLAELTAASDPDRAELYLQELLSLSGTHTGAYDLARKFRLRVARMSSASADIEVSPDYGGIAVADGEYDDLDAPQGRGAAGRPRAASRGPGRDPVHDAGRASRDSIDEFDPDELIGAMAHGSPAPGRPPRRPNGGYPQDADSFELDFEPSPSQATRQMSPEIVEALASSHGDELDGPLGGGLGGPAIVDRPRWAESLEDARALDAQLDDIELGDDIDRHVARELARGAGKPGPGGDDIADDVADDLPFDPDEARAFDAAVPRASNQVAVVRHPLEPGGTDAIYVSGFEETAMPRAAGASDTGAYDELPDDGLPISGGYDPYGTEAAQTPGAFGEPTVAQTVGGFGESTASTDAAFGEPTASTQSPPFGADTPLSFGTDTPPDRPPDRPQDHSQDRPPVHGSPRADTSMEDDLDEAEFYASQRMFAEAIDLLNTLLTRFPGHRLVLAKLREVEALAAGGEVAIDVGSGVGHAAAPGGTDALDIDEIEEMGPEELVELDANSQPIQAPRKRQPTVMLEKPVDEGDVDTHYDLGLAYKEMALYDDAIKAFEKALRAPGREVGCRVMIGMCLREQGNPSEAIHQFKQGLHAEPTERERQSLYYEIGITYEAIGDDAEALYFFEMVLKRDPTFADAATRAERLRARGGRATHSRDNDI